MTDILFTNARLIDPSQNLDASHDSDTKSVEDNNNNGASLTSEGYQ